MIKTTLLFGSETNKWVGKGANGGSKVCSYTNCMGTRHNLTWIFLSAALLVSCGSGGASSGGVGSPPSGEFYKAWGDGKAEISSYDVVTVQYGEARKATEVLIYVTEDMDGVTWIKDDQGKVPSDKKRKVLKLNRVRRFQTGVYDYSVMTSVFARVDKTSRERFAPVRITTTIQEWCGQTYFKMMPESNGYTREIRSYFSHEGEKEDRVDTTPGTLYEDALFVQLRELDDPFVGGDDWKGELVPSFWNAKKEKILPSPAGARFSRVDAELNGESVTRVEVKVGTREITFDIEKKPPKRILKWKTSDGETGVLKKTVRLPYWSLNHEGDEKYLEQLGL